MTAPYLKSEISILIIKGRNILDFEKILLLVKIRLI